MRKKIFRLFLISLFAFCLTSTTFAQRQTGSIFGTVVDEEGTPLPGATVTLSGPALMGTRTYVTTEEGRFRFPVLSPGEYEVKVEVPGFQTTTRKNIICNVGKTIDVTITLKVTTVEEEVTVTAASPVVDIESTKISVNYGANFLASIPLSRDLYDIQNSIPGAISEGVDYRRTSSILGGTVRSQLYALDGVPMNDPATFYPMSNINVDVYQEIEFELVSHPAEVGQADSTYINIVTKSGGNKFSGGISLLYTDKNFGQNLFTKEQVSALGVNPPEKYSDYKDGGINLGGPIIKDRLWFFINGRRQLWEQVNPLAPESRMAKLGLESPHYDVNHEEWMGFAKLTFQVSKNLRYMGMLHYNHIYEPIYSNSVGSDAAYEYVEIWDHENTYNTTHQFNLILDQNTFFDLRGTYSRRYFPIISITQDSPSIYDNIQKVWWGASPYNDEYIRTKMLASASLTRFQDDFLGFSHELKAGFEFEQTEYHRDWYRGNPYYLYWNDYSKKDPYYVSTSKKYGRLRIRTCPPERGQWDVQDHTRRFSGYVQDSATTGRLALNLGLRYDFSYQYEPEQNRPELRYDFGPPLMDPAITDPNALIVALSNKWHEDPLLGQYSPWDALTTPYKRIVEFSTFSPRIGLVYDIFGTGKTALKLSFSRYFEPVWSAKYNGGQIFGAGSIQYEWQDLNKDGNMDLPPTDNYRLESYPKQDPNYRYYVENLKCPYTDEILAGIEHELVKDFKLGFQFLFKRNKNIVEDIDLNNGYDTDATDSVGLIWKPFEFTDPGWDGLFNTDDDQKLTVYGLRSDRPIQTWRGTNPAEAKREYWALMLTFDKRMSNKWQLNGSILYSSFKGNAEGTYSPTEGESTMFDNPNTLVNGYGPIWFDRPLQIKIMGTYILPYEIITSAYLRYQSGSPWERTLERVYFPLNFGVQQTYVIVNAEQRGTKRNRSYTNLDLRVEKTFSFGNFGRLNFYMDVFNVAGYSGINVNQNPNGRVRNDKTPVTYELSTVYRLVTSVYGVRSFRLGLRWTF